MMEYERYKVEDRLWNTKIPSHWDIKPLYGIGSLKSICNCTDLPLLSVYLDSGVIPFEAKSEKRTNATSKDLSKYQRVDVGNLVLNNQQSWRGSVGVSNYQGIVSPAYLIVDLDDTLTREFANYLFRSPIMVGQYHINSKGVGSIQRNIYWQGLKRTMALIPPLSEQRKIVTYLDWQLSNINKLILNKKKSISLLHEQRQAIIDDNVIEKSASDNCQNKYGFSIPTGWSIVKFNGYFDFFKGLNITKKNLVDEGVSVISYGQVHSKNNSGTEIDDSLIRYVDEIYLKTSSNALVQRGDFIFADTSEDFEGVGNCVFVDRDDTIFAGYHTLVARPKDGKENRYLAYLFKSSFWRYQLRKNVNGVKVYSITQKVLKNVFVVLPPSKKQQEIVGVLDSKCKRISAEISKISEELLILEELKKKLIFDSVTGQIDVRDVEVPGFTYFEETHDDTDDTYDEDDIDEEV